MSDSPQPPASPESPESPTVATSGVGSGSVPHAHTAVRLHPADLTIHVEEIQAPEIEDADDAIIKVKLAGLCGSDLHGYRGHEKVHEIIVTGHEFVGEVVALGLNYSFASSSANTQGRPPLYSVLKVGDFVVSPFSASCGECQFCRLGFTSRCAHQLLFGSEALPGGQAQYVRVPRAGGVLFVIKSAPFPPSSSSSPPTPNTQTQDAPSPPKRRLSIREHLHHNHHNRTETQWTHALAEFSDSSLLLLADILPTGVFTALQTVQHPNIVTIIRGERFPLASVDALTLPHSQAPGIGIDEERGGVLKSLKERLVDSMWPSMKDEDRILTIAVIGLGPVGICASIALLDFLSSLRTQLRLYAVDLAEKRRENFQVVYDALPDEAKGTCRMLVVCSPEEVERLIMEKTGGLGCNAVMEVVGNTQALTLSYALLRPFGVIISAGVHQSPPLPFTGRQFYNKNVSLVSGRCPVRTVFPLAVDLLRRRQDVFGGYDQSGGERGLRERVKSFTHGHGHHEGAKSIAGVERVVSIRDAPEAYRKFAKGEWGKVAFDPWR